MTRRPCRDSSGLIEPSSAVVMRPTSTSEADWGTCCEAPTPSRRAVMKRSGPRSSAKLRRYHQVGIKRGESSFIVRVRRKGGEPTAGCVFFYPIWLVTRLRWQFSDRLWTAELSAAGRSGIGRKFKQEEFATADEAVARGEEWTVAVEQGLFDPQS